MVRKILFGLWLIMTVVISLIVGFASTVGVIPHLTSNAFLHFSLMLLLIYGVAFVLLILATRRQFNQPVRAAGLLAGLPVLLVILFYAIPNIGFLLWQPVPVDDDLLAALEANTIPLASVDSHDLAVLRPMLEGRQVVALGEATHGTSEFFRMKHSVIAYLVTDLGFRNYGMELSQDDGAFLNRYIHGEDVDPTVVLYWPWATEEIIAMLDWMRDYNAAADPADQLTLFGIDPRSGDRDRVMAENVTQIVADHGPIVLWAHNVHIWAGEGGMGSYLKDTFGDDAYLLGFEFSQGLFTSRTGVIDTFEVGAAPPVYYAHALAMLDAPVLFLDMTTMQQNPLLAEWLNTPQFSRNLSEAYHVARFLPGTRTASQPFPDVYDGLIFIEYTTPAQVLAGME